MNTEDTVRKNEDKKAGKSPFRRFVVYISRKFDLGQDPERQAEAVESIKKNVEFRGTNLWILIFAILIASLGLNINSTAVVIGAMLISPLMGPTMGIGLALGINDFELMKRSFRNYIFMVVVSVITSAIYFWVSPISHAQSELLARTNPTVYDVLIAFFGGVAGILAYSRQDKTSMVIPGVAIATTLLPPLCTAGYGIATLQWKFIGSALFLFFINTVFIAIATYLMVRFLKYPHKVFIDKARERRVKNYMAVIVVAALIPSLIMSYNIVQRTVFESSAERFVTTVFQFPDTQVIDYSYEYRPQGGISQITAILVGEALSDETIRHIRAQMPGYGLTDVDLTVRQSTQDDKLDLGTLAVSYTQLLDEKNRKISELETLVAGAADTLAMRDISREAAAVVDNIATISVSQQIKYTVEGVPRDTVLVGIVSPVDPKKGIDSEKLARWLGARAKSASVKIYVEDKPAATGAQNK